MKQIIILSTLLIIFILQGCVKKVNTVSDTNSKVYKIENTNEDFFQWDKFVDNATVIPLETTPGSVIGLINKGIIDNNNIYLLDYKNQKFLKFDLEGNFINSIGKKGKGPKEYLEIRDFCITDNFIYTLDYGKINCYNKNEGNFVNSFQIKNTYGFNPNSFIVYDPQYFFLWTSNPDVWDKNKGEYYRMRKIVNGSVVKEYFKYTYSTSDDTRFYKNGDESYYLMPIDGEYKIYKLFRDSIFTSFKLDFGKNALQPEEIDKLRKSKIRNAYLKSNSFKSISDILETNDYIFFKCIGPGSKRYEGLINKKTGRVNFGRWDYKRSPFFFYSDGKYLYGYYEPHTLLQELDGEVSNSCFKHVRENLKDLMISDNYIIVKVLLK